MTRVAVVAGPDAGHAFPAMALARALTSRGNVVAVATGDRWSEYVTREGARYLPLPLLAADPRDDDFAHRLWGRGAEMAPPLAELLTEFAPDVVVADTLTVAGWFAADLLGVPHVELVPHTLQLPSVALPPPGFPAAPGRNVVTRRRDAMLRRWHAKSLELAAHQRQAARLSIGLPADSRPVLRLVATLPALEWARPDWPREAVICGPLDWEPPDDPVLAIPEGYGYCVLVADSTATGGRRGLVQLALEALPDTDLGVVATTLDAAVVTAPPGAVVGRSRQLPLLERVDAVVCAGGHGIVSKALGRGVPVVVVPGPGDQRANGVRVEAAGAGVVIDPNRLTAARLRTAVRRVVMDHDYRLAAERVAASAHSLGPAFAARLVEGVRAE